MNEDDDFYIRRHLESLRALLSSKRNQSLSTEINERFLKNLKTV
jgi:hypothetical protein